MNCPSCNSSLEQNARFCGVCGFRLQQARVAAGAAGSGVARSSSPALARPPGAAARSPSAPAGPRPPAKGSAAPKPKKPMFQGDESLIDKVLNNRFRIESKIGEGGFGAVYRGVQLATQRKVALKLLHPEMTKDDNLVARFRQEGMVLCNLRDAHTITTYDFDQDADGTLYIAMELLEGKSLHQVFHDEQRLEWRRVFKILSEMCSSLAEAHAQGIVHRDLKPENIYLESRPGNPEFVKILDFGIAKVMRGESIDPQQPQLTATGQTLGTLEYMSPEQLMGKPLDGRSDVYALGVLAYEMITGRLPFPEAKGPAGLITAQLKQTPVPPSQAYPKAGLPSTADQVILKCLEKDKKQRFVDVSALSFALQEVASTASGSSAASSAGLSAGLASLAAARPEMDLNETQRSNPPSGMQGTEPPFAVQGAPGIPQYTPPSPSQPSSLPRGVSPYAQHVAPPPVAPMTPYPVQASQGAVHGAGGMVPSRAPSRPARPRAAGSSRWVWWVVALLVLGAASGAVLALIMRS